MSRVESRMGQIVRWDAKKDASFVQALHLELDRETAARVGRAYGIISADTSGRTGQALAAHLEDAFVRGAAEAVRKLPADAPQDQLFEAAIARVNHALGRLFGEYGLELEPETVTAAIIAVHEHDVVASTWGRPTMLLYHPMVGSAKIFDLADDGGPDRSAFKTVSNRRCFGSIIAGRMGRRDRILLASHDLRALLGDEAVEATVISNEPAIATQVLEQLLAPGRAGSVAALVLDVAEIRYVEHDPSVAMHAERAVPPGHASIAKLLKTQSEAAETLTPSLIGGIGKKMGGLLKREPSTRRAAAPEPVTEPEYAYEEPEPSEASPARGGVPLVPPEETPAPAMPPRTVSADPGTDDSPTRTVILVSVIKALFGLLMAIARGLWKLVRATALFLYGVARPSTRQVTLVQTRVRIRERVAGAWRGFVTMSLGKKAALFAAVVLAATVQTALVVQARSRAKEEQLAMHERAIDSITQKLDAAEASIIYRDEERAKSLLSEAAVAISALPELQPEDASKKSAFNEKIAGIRQSIRREIPLDSPTILASITSANGQPTLAKAALADGSLWLASDAGEIFRVTLADGSAEKLGDVSGKPAAFLAQGKDVLAIGADGQGSLITAGGKVTAKTVTFDAGTAIADTGIYNGRLYALDPAHNRIVRHIATADGFGTADSYMKDGTDLSKAVSMAIDGLVWVLRADGSVVRLAKGVQESFAVGSPDPAVTAPLRLRTEDDANLFVLDSSPSRILRYNKKTGALIGQYVSPSLDGATDFAVNAAGNTAYVLVKNQVLTFTLPEAK